MKRALRLLAVLCIAIALTTMTTADASPVTANCNGQIHPVPASGQIYNDFTGAMAAGFSYTPDYPGSSNRSTLLLAGRGTDSAIWAQPARMFALNFPYNAQWDNVWYPLGGGTYYSPIVTGGVSGGSSWTNITVKGTDGYRYSKTDQNGTGWGNWTNIGVWTGANPTPDYTEWPAIPNWSVGRDFGLYVRYTC